MRLNYGQCASGVANSFLKRRTVKGLFFINIDVNDFAEALQKLLICHF